MLRERLDLLAEEPRRHARLSQRFSPGDGLDSSDLGTRRHAWQQGQPGPPSESRSRLAARTASASLPTGR